MGYVYGSWKTHLNPYDVIGYLDNEAQHRIILKKNGKIIGKQIKVLTEKSLGRGRFLGRSEWDAPEIDGNVELRGEALEVGRFYQATVTQAKPYALVAEI